jgi:hypothetical protein
MRNTKGQFLNGISGNPSGRPRGAKDSKPRKPYCRTWDRTPNLGFYALLGGPGRIKGSTGSGCLIPELSMLLLLDRLLKKVESPEYKPTDKEVLGMALLEIKGYQASHPNP